jgi:hypothetical protein
MDLSGLEPILSPGTRQGPLRRRHVRNSAVESEGQILKAAIPLDLEYNRVTRF